MTQHERVARNNSLFREANEAIRAAADQEQPPMDTIPFLCECPREDCNELVRMTADAYAGVRAHSTHFVTVPGHDRLEGPHATVERTHGYVVVDKTGPAREIVRENWNETDR